VTTAALHAPCNPEVSVGAQDRHTEPEPLSKRPHTSTLARAIRRAHVP